MPDLSDEYSNAAHIPGGKAYPARWRAKAAAFRANHSSRVIPYGPGRREMVRLIAPADAARGTLVFVHGGYWSAFHPDDFSHLAAGALARGWRVALPGYDLCPALRIAAITRSIVRAVERIATECAGPLVLTGHSAGGHLVARTGCADVTAGARITRIVPVSPLADLAPLMRTTMNGKLQIDTEEAQVESPALHPAPAASVHIWIGGAERPAFIDQARLLARSWNAPLTIEPGRHHFDIVDGYEIPDSPLMQALLDGAG